MTIYVVIFEASHDWGYDCVCFSDLKKAEIFSKTVNGKVRKCYVEKG
jgi:hypothetical protein